MSDDGKATGSRVFRSYDGVSVRVPEGTVAIPVTLVLLLCVLPVLAAYTYWTVEHSNVYVNELKQSARAVSSGLVERTST